MMRGGMDYDTIYLRKKGTVTQHLIIKTWPLLRSLFSPFRSTAQHGKNTPTFLKRKARCIIHGNKNIIPLRYWVHDIHVFGDVRRRGSTTVPAKYSTWSDRTYLAGKGWETTFFVGVLETLLYVGWG